MAFGTRKLLSIPCSTDCKICTKEKCLQCYNNKVVFKKCVAIEIRYHKAQRLWDLDATLRGDNSFCIAQ